MRAAARFLAWQIRFACENNEHDKIMRAWHRLNMITEYLKKDTFLMSFLVLVSVEDIRLDALERVLSSGILSDNELSVIQQYLRDSAAGIPEINRNALYFETVVINDALCAVADGSLSDDTMQIGSEGLKHYRFLLPGIWYWVNCNYLDYLLRTNVRNLCGTTYPVDDRSPWNVVSSMVMPAFNGAGEMMHNLEMRYQAFVVLIEAEKIRRKTGKYPEKVPLNIIDHFSGELLHYKLGNHEVREASLCYDDFLSEWYVNYRTKNICGIAVWSVGRNKADDYGLCRTSDKNGKNTDDQRALITISQ